MSVNATNVDPSGWPLPFYNSWHAYFLVSDVSKAVITLDPSSAWTHIDVFNNSNKYSNLIPTGHVSPWPYWQNSAVGGSFLNPTYYDDEVKALSQRPMFTHSITDGHINTLFWADSNYNFVQVFTGAPAGWGDQSIAMEAMSGKADAFNNHDGLHIIEAGESFVSQFGIRMN